MPSTFHSHSEKAANSEEGIDRKFAADFLLGRHKHLSDSKQPSMSQAIAKTVKGPVEYRLEGNGPTVMVLNGGHCSRESRLSHERLAEHGFSVLTPSRPGYDSTPSEVGRTAQQAADALAALMDSLQIPIA